ncbi:Crp/Fnr family transcriptional regulator [Mucilaginibacter sp. 22184]|uniref:Crp/Fnr family transcriptional regulator n=1 Tax=Mucilaginibacter sp. 22184 TaxID=3453887 RepID=UPI003F8682DD
MDSIKAAIRSITPMSDADLSLLEPVLATIQVKKRTHLLEEGQVCRHVYFLNKGFFRMYYVDLEGNAINSRFVEAPQFFVDFNSFLSQQPSRYYWEAMQDSEVFTIKYDDVQAIYAKSAAWDRFGRLMAEHVYKQVNERIEMLLFLSPEDRYQFLLNKYPQLFNQVSQFHIASYLGVKPESLSRLRKRLLRK